MSDWTGLEAGLRELNIDIDVPKEQYLLFRDILLEWNEKMNLTRITDFDEMERKHFLDSLTPLHYQEVQAARTILDIGSGAGFPGIVLAAVMEGDFTLLDSLGKRVTFLTHVAEELALTNVRPLHGRAEELGRQKGYREQYDLVLARAVARLNTLAEYMLPFVKVGGYALAMKGEQGAEEVEEARRGIEKLGGRVKDVYSLSLTGEEHRDLILIEKVKPTPEKYPRGGGKPRKDPL